MEFWGRHERYRRAFQNKFHLYISGKKLPGTAENLKVNEQSKYKSVPILFLFLVIEGKPDAILDFLSLRCKSEITL